MSLYVYLLYFENNLVIFYTTNFFEIIIFTYTYNLTKLYLSKYNSSFNYLLFPHIRIIVVINAGKWAFSRINDNDNAEHTCACSRINDNDNARMLGHSIPVAWM